MESFLIFSIRSVILKVKILPEWFLSLMLLLSTSSLTWYWLHHTFALAKKAWFDWIDLCIEHNLYDTWDREYISSLIEQFSLPVLSMSAPSTKLNEEKVDQIINIAKHIGAEVVSFSPPHISDKNTKWFRQYLPKIKKEEWITFSVQNVAPKFLFFIIPEYKNSTLEQIKKTTGFTTLDVGGVDVSSGIDLTKAYDLLGSSIKNIFLSDRDSNGKEGLLPGNAWNGVSHLPLESFLMKLKKNNYTWHISLKINPNELFVGDEEKIQEQFVQFQNYYHKYYTNFN